MTDYNDFSIDSLDLKSRSLNSTLFNLANAYSESANLTNDKMNESKNADFAGPAIMCLSFSIELLLKFFIFISEPNSEEKKHEESLRKKMHGHKFTDLFDDIDNKFQIKISKTFSEITRKETDVTQFRENLVELGDPFVKWRYIYETKEENKIDTHKMRNTCDALGLAAAVERKKLSA